MHNAGYSGKPTKMEKAFLGLWLLLCEHGGAVMLRTALLPGKVPCVCAITHMLKDGESFADLFAVLRALGRIIGGSHTQH